MGSQTPSIHTWLSHIPADSPSPSPPQSPSPSSIFPSPSPRTRAHLDANRRQLKRKSSEDLSLGDCKRLKPGRPLTRRALRSISANMVQKKKADGVTATPQKQTSASSSAPSALSEALASEALISEITTSSEALAKQIKNVATIRAALAHHGMWFDKKENYNKCSEFKAMVDKIFYQERPSRMQESSCKKIIDFIEKNSMRNEDTLFSKLTDLVVKDERTVATTDPIASISPNVENEIVYILQSFESDGMAIPARNQLFLKGFLPGKMDTKEQNQFGLTEPKPDYTFGTETNQTFILGEAPSPVVSAIIGVCPGVEHPFFVIEGKGCSQPIDVARNQAIRDGATVVNARRILNALAAEEGAKQPIGADINSFTFSCTWDPRGAEIWVHWYEKFPGPDGHGVYHMTFLHEYSMRSPDALRLFRRHIHNIFDWGLLTNNHACQMAMGRIKEKERAAKTTVRRSPLKAQTSPSKMPLVDEDENLRQTNLRDHGGPRASSTKVEPFRRSPRKVGRP